MHGPLFESVGRVALGDLLAGARRGSHLEKDAVRGKPHKAFAVGVALDRGDRNTIVGHFRGLGRDAFNGLFFGGDPGLDLPDLATGSEEPLGPLLDDFVLDADDRNLELDGRVGESLVEGLPLDGEGLPRGVLVQITAHETRYLREPELACHALPSLPARPRVCGGRTLRRSPSACS